ncbi:MAG: hypothetical protein HFE68_04130 [Erysipelotrichaceae bacterium]|nr:hypothetical protein [Erysipelotrichaceae bacterium]
MSNEEMALKLNEISKAKKQYNKLKAKIEQLQDDLKQEMINRGQEEEIIGDYTVQCISYDCAQFDMNRFKEEHGRLYKRFAVPTTRRRLTIR